MVVNDSKSFFYNKTNGFKYFSALFYFDQLWLKFLLVS